jgi:hypothetical protein
MIRRTATVLPLPGASAAWPPAPPRDAPPRGRRRGRALSGLLCALLGLALAGMPLHAQQAAPDRGRIIGVLEGAPEGVKVEGTRVVLVQFKLDEKGVPKGEPIQTHTVGADGRFSFTDVPIAARTVYQVGATVAGQVVGSQPFTFPAGERSVQISLRFPRLVTDDRAVHIVEGLLAVEPRRGAVWVTEVLHLVNPGQDVVEGVQHPLELELPSGAKDLEMIREIQDKNGHERLGGKLLVYGNLEPGRTTVAFRYRLPVWLGSVVLRKRFPHPVDLYSVLTPQDGRLHLDATGFSPEATQTIDKTPFNAWAARDLPADKPIAIRLSGVPVRQEVYLLPTGGFALLMVGVVAWFLRRRLRGGEPDASD